MGNRIETDTNLVVNISIARIRESQSQTNCTPSVSSPKTSQTWRCFFTPTQLTSFMRFKSKWPKRYSNAYKRDPTNPNHQTHLHFHFASMASSGYLLLLSFLLFLTISQTHAKTFRPKALLLPVTKDSSLLQYTTQIKQRTPLVPIKLTIDVGGQFMWVDCEKGYVSSSYRPVPCDSKVCNISRAGACIIVCPSPPGPGCNNNTCYHLLSNPFISTTDAGELATDALSIQSTDGRSAGPAVSVPGLVFTCGSHSLLKGLSNGAKVWRTIVNRPYNSWSTCLDSVQLGPSQLDPHWRYDRISFYSKIIWFIYIIKRNYLFHQINEACHILLCWLLSWLKYKLMRA